MAYKMTGQISTASLSAKLKEMLLKQETLMDSLGIAYDPEEHKKLSILNHRINVATERRKTK